MSTTMELDFIFVCCLLTMIMNMTIMTPMKSVIMENMMETKMEITTIPPSMCPE